MKIQLDANIVIDILEEREPFVHATRKLLNRAFSAGHSFCVPASSIDNIAYILRKNFTPQELTKGLKKFFNTIHISAVDEKVIKLALNAGWKDLEDAIQYFSAIEAGATLIVTRDVKGYEEQRVKVVTPEDALGLLKS